MRGELRATVAIGDAAAFLEDKDTIFFLYNLWGCSLGVLSVLRLLLIALFCKRKLMFPHYLFALEP